MNMEGLPGSSSVLVTKLSLLLVAKCYGVKYVL